ncbi:MAG: hypothetical protein J0M35_04965 [Candidatus Obscuribacter phosphatis]|uniref:Tetratricopeptide repeat protein n=1 Tax=Candidatus Obscuribacter phosphatis TaxID=1906157 RepID=A0A8J7TLC7_9BACT|nr:hypothetical protein [Candidatus Obscuribacter phosphatis]
MKRQSYFCTSILPLSLSIGISLGISLWLPRSLTLLIPLSLNLALAALFLAAPQAHSQPASDRLPASESQTSSNNQAPASSQPEEIGDRPMTFESAERKHARACIKVGKYRDAVYFLDRHIRRHPQDGRVLVNLGYCLEKLKEPEKAQRYYSQAMQWGDAQDKVYAEAALARLPHLEKQTPRYLKSEKDGSAETKVRFIRGARYIKIETKMQGRPLEMIFEPEAHSTISIDQLRALGLPAPTGKYVDFTPVIGGSDVKYWLVKVNLTIGSITLKDYEMMVLEKSHDEPILGQPFVGQYSFKVDPEANTITFKAKAGGKASSQSIQSICLPPKI